MLFFFGLSFTAPVLAAEEGAPTISAAPIVISVGGTYDPLEGLVVTDDVDTEAELLANIYYYDKEVDVSTPGSYIIFYDLADSDNHWVSFRRNVLVLGTDFPVIGVTTKGIYKDSPFDPYADVYAFDLKDGDITSSIKIIANDVDLAVPGDYYITYEVTDSDLNTVQETRHIVVLWPEEYQPVITAPTLYLKVGDEFDPMEGVTATDLTDGDITESVTVEHMEVDTMRPGIYWVQYVVYNSLGLMSFADRTVVVFDMTTSPSIVSGEYYYLETGEPFDPLAGVYAYDLEDGDITHLIKVVENTVDTSQPGEYHVLYGVTDSDGNIAEHTAYITVGWSWMLYPEIHVDPYVVYLELGGAFYPMEGVTATDATDGEITSNIVVYDYVDTSMPGVYYIEYEVTNSLGLSSGASRQVIVFESSVPIIMAYDFESPLNQEIDKYSVHFEAYDLEDGDIWESIVWDISAVDINTAGKYPIILSVTDSDGNKAETTCYVTVKDYSYPELEVYDYSVIIGSDYDPINYAYAWDQKDGEISYLIQVPENNVDINTLGTYTVTYSVTNSQDKTTTKTVNVSVINEPVIDYYLIYDGNMVRIEIDEQAQMAYITSPVLIPAGSMLSMAIYADGELTFEFPGLIISNEVLPGFKYSLSSNGEELLATILPYIFDGSALRLNAKTGEITIKSTVDGEFYYVVTEKGAAVPDIDTSGTGIPGAAGTNSFRIEGLKPGVKPQVAYVVLKAAGGEITNVISIDFPTIPDPPNNGKKPDNPGKPEDQIISPDIVEEVPEVEEPKTNKGQDKKDEPSQLPVLKEPKTNNGQEKKVETTVVEAAAEELKKDKGLGQEKKEEEITAEEVIEEVPMSPDAELIEIRDDEKDKDKEKKADENIELLEEKTNNGKSDKG
ncbi:immunoglobulin-like domain-containing protein [Youngiibacter fragilis]|nr:immunoglobulin-like domain-containing protein [Youngiibacter fragilis]